MNLVTLRRIFVHLIFELGAYNPNTNMISMDPISASMCNWDLFKDADHLSGLLKCLKGHQWRAICDRLIKNHRHTRSGFPDLTLWNPDLGICSFVEVKGPNDRLSAKQILWIEYLNNHGISSVVCHVEALNARKLVASSGEVKSVISPRKASPLKKTPTESPAKTSTSKNPPRKRQAKKAGKEELGQVANGDNSSCSLKVPTKRNSSCGKTPNPKSKKARHSSGDDFQL